MKINQNDYLVLRVGNKSLLARVTFAEDKKYKAVIETNKSEIGDKPEHIEFEFGDVISNLGRAPRAGSVYGQKIEPLLKRFTAGNAWEEVQLYQHLTEEQEKTLRHELIVASKKLKELRISGLKHILEIRQAGGKYAGYHKYRPKLEIDILCVKPEVNLDGLHYLIFHEYAHGMWHRMLTARMRMRWIQLYHQYITLDEILEEDLAATLSEIVSAGSIRDFLKDCDDRSMLIVKDAVRHIQHVHSLNKRHIELMLEHSEDITVYWPKALELAEKETCITEYARKSPEEFFAEAMAFSLCGRTVPKKIQAILEKTMSNLVRPSYPR